jgi:hypothetical protein
MLLKRLQLESFVAYTHAAMKLQRIPAQDGSRRRPTPLKTSSTNLIVSKANLGGADSSAKRFTCPRFLRRQAF